MLIRKEQASGRRRKGKKQEKNPENVQKVVDTGFYLYIITQCDEL